MLRAPLRVEVNGFQVVHPAARGIGQVSKGAAVSDVETELPLYEFGSVSLFNTLSREAAEDVKRRRNIPYTTRAVKTQTLNNILAAHGFGDQKVDFLSVDVEGHDLEVLQSLDFSIHQPKMICVELHESDVTKVLASPLYNFLTSRGHVLAYWLRPSLIFVRSEDRQRLPFSSRHPLAA